MNVKFVKAAAFAIASSLAMTAGSALAQDGEAKSLDQLLEFVKKGQVTEAKENRAREQRFSKDKANQASELKRLKPSARARRGYPPNWKTSSKKMSCWSRPSRNS